MLLEAALSESLLRNNIQATGVLHVGAHSCEERPVYNALGVSDADIYWIEANGNKVTEAAAGGIPNVYEAIVSDVDGSAQFNLASDSSAGSLLMFGSHLAHYTDVYMTESRDVTTHTLASLVAAHNIPVSSCNVWRVDAQGAELKVLQGAGELLGHCKALCVRVHNEELFQGCATAEEVEAFLTAQGFVRDALEYTELGWGEALFVHP